MFIKANAIFCQVVFIIRMFENGECSVCTKQPRRIKDCRKLVH